MGKLIKVIIALALLGGAIGLAVHYAGRSRTQETTVSSPPAAAPEEKGEGKAKDKPQLQEKYGFAPTDDGG